jgi:nitroreductase
MNPYSEDLRKKKDRRGSPERGMPKIEAARTFGVGISSVKRYVATYREGRSLVAPKKRPGSKPKLDPERARGSSWRRTSRNTRRRRPCHRGVSSWGGCARGFGQRLHRLQGPQAHGLEQKNRSVGASEREEFLRAAWRVMVAGEIAAERLGCSWRSAPPTPRWHLYMYACSLKGERALCVGCHATGGRERNPAGEC